MEHGKNHGVVLALPQLVPAPVAATLAVMVSVKMAVIQNVILHVKANALVVKVSVILAVKDNARADAVQDVILVAVADVMAIVIQLANQHAAVNALAIVTTLAQDARVTALLIAMAVAEVVLVAVVAADQVVAPLVLGLALAVRADAKETLRVVTTVDIRTAEVVVTMYAIIYAGHRVQTVPVVVVMAHAVVGVMGTARAVLDVSVRVKIPVA